MPSQAVTDLAPMLSAFAALALALTTLIQMELFNSFKSRKIALFSVSVAFAVAVGTTAE